MEGDTPEYTFEKILGRALVDHKYRADLIDQANPDTQKAALREMGVDDPDDDMIAALNQAIGALSSFADSFGASVQAS
jgi:hypothetical protein